MNNKNKIAKIDNQLVLKANYCLSANEQKLILFLISKIDPKTQKNFELQTVKLKDVERIFADDNKKWGSIYERVDKMCGSIMDKKITLPKGFIIRGKAITMHKYVQWFSGIEPFMDENGEISIKFRFAVQLNTLQHFKKWANQQGTKEQSAATFVNWWVQQQVFSHEQDVFWKLNEKVDDYIKTQDAESKANRELAKDLPNETFVEQYKKAAAA